MLLVSKYSITAWNTDGSMLTTVLAHVTWLLSKCCCLLPNTQHRDTHTQEGDTVRSLTDVALHHIDYTNTLSLYNAAYAVTI